MSRQNSQRLAAAFLSVVLASAFGQSVRAQNAGGTPSYPGGGTSIAAVAPPAAAPQRTTNELQRLAAPIALYPDPLIASILPAAVYPVEIVIAARFVKDTNNLPKVDQQTWDAHVKTVAKMPGVIAKMDADLDWTVQLGQAFLAQPMDLMNAIQDLRTKAEASGRLKTTPQQVVFRTNSVVERSYEGQIVYVTNTVIQVQPANPEIVYVPSYSPSVVYVDNDYDDEAAAVVSFGVGMMFGAAIWGHCDWHYGGCYWGHHPPPPPPMPPPYHPPPGTHPPPSTRPPGGTRPPSGTRPPPGSQPPGTSRPAPGATGAPTTRWQPDQNRLRTSGATPAATSQARGWGSKQFSSPAVTGGRNPGGLNRAPGVSPGISLDSGRRGTSDAWGARSSDFNRSAFDGVGSGANNRSFSNRGSTSRGSSGFRGEGGGMRGGGGGRRR